MKKHNWRCILSKFLVLSLTITTVLQTTVVTAKAENGSALINNPLTMPVSVYSEDSYTKDNVLNNLKANNDSTYDMKKYYTPVGYTSNMSQYSGKPLGSSLASFTDERYWISYFFDPPSEMKDAWRKGDYSVAVLYDSYKWDHYWSDHWYESKQHYYYWTYVKYNNTKRSVNSSGQYDTNNAWTTHGVNKTTGELSWLQGGSGTYANYGDRDYHTIYFSGARSCTSIANIGVQMMDTIGPAVVGAYVLKSTGNPDKTYSYETQYDTADFPQGSDAYIAVEFDEPVKIKDGTDLNALKLNLNTISNIDNTSKEQKADFFALDCNDGGGGKRIVFKYTVPADVDMRLSDLNIENSNFVTDKAVLDLPGNEVGRNTYPVKSNQVKKLSGEAKTAYFDSIPPSVSRTDLTVIPASNRKIITNGSSSTGLYYTTGDEITFDECFSETLDETKFDTKDLSLKVNIGNDGSGGKTRTISNPEFIKNSKLSANARSGSVLKFKYVIQDGDDTHQPVTPMELIVANNSKIMDLRQNEFTDYDNFKAPAQRIFIDTVKPTATVEKIDYTDFPAFYDPDLYGCYKITFNKDDFSSTDGVYGDAALWYYNNQSDKTTGEAADYLIGSTSPTFPAGSGDSVYNGYTTGDTFKVPEIANTAYYLHYKLPDKVECQNVELDLSGYDLAGNINNYVTQNSIVIDKTLPVISIQDQTIYSMSAPFPANFAAAVAIDDNSSNLTNYTQWTDTGTNYDDANWMIVLNYTASTKKFDVQCPISDDVNNKTLWVKSVDDKGNSSIENHQFVYDGRGPHYTLVFNDKPSKILADHDIDLSVAADTEFYYQWVKKGETPDDSKYIKVAVDTTTPAAITLDIAPNADVNGDITIPPATTLDVVPDAGENVNGGTPSATTLDAAPNADENGDITIPPATTLDVVPDAGENVNGGTTTPAATMVTETTIHDTVDMKIGNSLQFTGNYELYYKAKNKDSGNESQVMENEFSFSNAKLGANGEITLSDTKNFGISEGAQGFPDLLSVRNGLPWYFTVRRTFDGIYFTLSINDKTYGGNKTVDYGSPETYYGIVNGKGETVYKKPLPPQDTAKLTFPTSAFDKTGKDYKAIISIKSVGSNEPYKAEFPVAIEKNTFNVGGLVGISDDYANQKQSISVQDAGKPLYTNVTEHAYLNFQAVSDEAEALNPHGIHPSVRFSLDPNDLGTNWFPMEPIAAIDGGTVIYRNEQDLNPNIRLDNLSTGVTVLYYQFATVGGYASDIRSTTIHVDRTAPEGELKFNFGDANKDNSYPAIKRDVFSLSDSYKSIDYYMKDLGKFVNNTPVTVSVQNISDNYSDAKDLTVDISAYIRAENSYAYDAAQDDLTVNYSGDDTKIQPNTDGSYTFNKEGYIKAVITDPCGNETVINSNINWIHTKAVYIYDGPKAGYYTYDTFADFENTNIDTLRKGLLNTPEGNYAVTAVVGDYTFGPEANSSVSDVYYAFNKEYQAKLKSTGIADEKTGLVWYKAGEPIFGMSSTYGRRTIDLGSDGQFSSVGQFFTLKSQCQYDPSRSEGDTVPITVYVKAADLAGHESDVKEVNITPKNVKPAIVKNEYSSTDGYVLKFNVPVTLTDLSSDKNGKSSMVHKNVSIYYNGDHTVKFKDVFGNEYEQTITASIFDAMYDHVVTVTPDTAANQPVTVTLSTKNNDGLYIDADIISGGDVTVSGVSTVGGITGNVCTGATIIVTQNGSVSYNLKSTKPGINNRQFTIPINNIDTTTPTADVEYVYFSPVDNGKTIGKVVAQLTNASEPITMRNGDINYTFTKGTKGDEYTFEFMDNAGNIGTAKAVLPVDIAFSDAPDTTPPDYSLKFMTQNASGINVVADYTGTQYESVAAAGNFSLDPTNGKILIDVLPIDETEVTASLKEPVDGVSLSGYRLTFSKDASCDVILTDAASNSTTVSIKVDKVIDNEPPNGTFDYIADNQNIRAYITVSDNLSKSENIAITNKTGVQHDKSRNQYFYEFNKNGIFTFVIEDQAGNVARPEAVVGGIDTTPLTAELQKWIPSLNTDYPTEQYDMLTNKNVKAVYTLSKPIKKVEITPASAYNKVNVSFSNDTLIAEFKENTKVSLTLYDYSDNMFTIDIPEVKNIDKTVPIINVSLDPGTGRTKQVKATFASNKLVLLTSEAVADSKDYKTTYEKTLNQNGDYVSTFVDMAGNIVPVEYTVSNINAAPPNLYILGATAENVPPTNKDINIQVVSTQNGTVYFNNEPYKVQGTDASVKNNEVVVGDMSKALPITVSINGRYDVTVEDEFSNRASAYFEITNIDKTPPVITLASYKILMEETGTTLADLKTAALEGVTALDKFDNKDLISQVSIDGITQDDLNKQGVYVINYRVSDTAGNETVISRKVCVYDKSGMIVKINGTVAAQYNTSILSTTQISVTTNISGPEYKMTYKKGYNTIGEMKHAEAFDGSFTAPNSGYYTIVVETQGKVYSIYYIYVDAM